jgi:hypothetical protein
MSAVTIPVAPSATNNVPSQAEETVVSRFLAEQIKRFEDASAAVPGEANQNAVFAALLDDFAQQMAAGLGALAWYYHDSEAALGPMLVTAVNALQEQRAARRKLYGS